MKKSKYTTTLGFLLSFFFILLFAQTLLFIVFFSISIKPLSNDLSKVFILAMETTKLIDASDQKNKSNQLQSIMRDHPYITISNNELDLEDIPWYFFGLKLLESNIELLEKQKIKIGFFSNNLVMKSTEQPKVSLIFKFTSPGTYTTYIKYSFFMIIFLSIIASFFILNQIINPLKQLTYNILLSENNNKIKITNSNIYEIKVLSEALNDMRSAINSSIEKREHLLAGITHDIRTPLSRIRIAMELETFITPSFKQALLEDIYEINHIIQQFNEYARLDIESKEEFELHDLNNLILDISNKYCRANIHINLNLCKNKINLMIKPLSITRLLYNLIDNGCRFGNGNVTIQTFQNEKEIIISISNPTDKYTKEFVYKTDSIFNNSTGLGLLIVKKFSEQHNAKLIEIKTQNTREYRVIFDTRFGN